MRYQLEVWEQETQSKKLPSTVIPIVFYHGKKKWKYKPFLHYFKHVDKELQQYLPSFEYIFINLNAIPDEIILQLRIGMLLNTMMVFKHAQDEKYITEQFELIFKDAHWIDDETKRNFLSATLVYLVRCTELSTEKFNEIATPILKEKNSLKMTTYDQFKLEARQEGLQEGRQEGRQEGKIEHAQQVIRAAWEDKFPVATIARLVKLSVEEVEAIIATFEKK
jgi:predicted transposase/invertase (TIGR01784 family)